MKYKIIWKKIIKKDTIVEADNIDKAKEKGEENRSNLFKGKSTYNEWIIDKIVGI